MEKGRFIKTAELTNSNPATMALKIFEIADSDFNQLAFKLLEEGSTLSNVSLVFAGFSDNSVEEEYASIGISYGTTPEKESPRQYMLVSECDDPSFMWQIYTYLVTILSKVTDGLVNTFDELLKKNPYGPVWKTQICE